MSDDTTWLEKRRRAREGIVAAIVARTGVTRQAFVTVFWDAEAPPTIGEFESAYMPDAETRSEIRRAIAAEAGLDSGDVERCWKRLERFPVFAERLLRAGGWNGSER